MAKLPKNLSSNNRPMTIKHSGPGFDARKNSPKAYDRSFSGMVLALQKSGPRGKFSDTNAAKEIILQKIKREENRLAKMLAFGTPPIGRETKEDQDRAYKISRKRSIITNLHFQLMHINDAKQSLDRRELNKHDNKTLIEDGVMVRLEKGKLTPLKRFGVGPENTNPVQVRQMIKKNKRKITKVLLSERKMSEMIKEEKKEAGYKEQERRDRALFLFRKNVQKGLQSKEEIEMALNLLNANAQERDLIEESIELEEMFPEEE